MSLATTPTRALAVCSACAGHRVTEITMTLADGSAVAFTSCHSCETRSWTQGGRQLDLTAVLGKAQKRRS